MPEGMLKSHDCMSKGVLPHDHGTRTHLDRQPSDCSFALTCRTSGQEKPHECMSKTRLHTYVCLLQPEPRQLYGDPCHVTTAKQALWNCCCRHALGQLELQAETHTCGPRSHNRTHHNRTHRLCHTTTCHAIYCHHHPPHDRDDLKPNLLHMPKSTRKGC